MPLTPHYNAFITSRVQLEPLLVDLLDVRNLVIDESRTTNLWAGLDYEQRIAWGRNRFNIRHFNKMSNPHNTRPEDIGSHTYAQSNALLNGLLSSGIIPFSRIGTPDKMPLNISGEHKSSGTFMFGRCSGAICMEGDGTLTMLRNGTDGVSTGVYYGYASHAASFGTAKDAVYTSIAYRADYLIQDWHVQGILQAGPNVVMGSIISPDGLERKYFVSITNNTIGGYNHDGFFIDPNPEIDTLLMEGSYGIAFTKDTFFLFTELQRQIPTDPVGVRVLGVESVSTVYGTSVPLSAMVGWYGRDAHWVPFTPRDHIKISDKLYTRDYDDVNALFVVEPEAHADPENVNVYGIKFYPFVTEDENLMVRFAMRTIMDNTPEGGTTAGMIPGTTTPIPVHMELFNSALFMSFQMNLATKECLMHVPTSGIQRPIVGPSFLDGVLYDWGGCPYYSTQESVLLHACWENSPVTDMFPFRGKQAYLLGRKSGKGPFAYWVQNENRNTIAASVPLNVANYYGQTIISFRDYIIGTHQQIVSANMHGYRQISQNICMYLGSGWNQAKMRNETDWILSSYGNNLSGIPSYFQGDGLNINAREKRTNHQFLSGTSVGEAGKYRYCRSMTENVIGDENSFRFSSSVPYATNSIAFGSGDIRTVSGVNVNLNGASNFTVSESGFYPVELSTAFIGFVRSYIHSLPYFPNMINYEFYMLEVFTWQYHYNCPCILAYTYIYNYTKHTILFTLSNEVWTRTSGRPNRTGSLSSATLTRLAYYQNPMPFLFIERFNTARELAAVTVAVCSRNQGDNYYTIGFVLSDGIINFDETVVSRFRVRFNISTGTFSNLVRDTVNIKDNPETFLVNFDGFGLYQTDQRSTDGGTRVKADVRVRNDGNLAQLSQHWLNWESVINPPIVNIYQDNPRGFTVQFLMTEPVVINGVGHVMERTSFNLADINPTPANKRFYVYVGIYQGDNARYAITETPMTESQVNMWIGTVDTNATGIESVDVFKVSRIDEYRAAYIPRGSSFPIAEGYPADEGHIRMDWTVLPKTINGTFTINRSVSPTHYDVVDLQVQLTNPQGAVVRTGLPAVGGDNSFKAIPIDGIREVRGYTVEHSNTSLFNNALPILMTSDLANIKYGLPAVANRFYLLANDEFYTGDNTGSGTFTLICQTDQAFDSENPPGTLLWRGQVETRFDGNASNPYPRSRVVSTEYASDRPVVSKDNIINGQIRGGDMWVEGVTGLYVKHLGIQRVDRYDVSQTPRYQNPMANNRRYLNGIINAQYVGLGVSNPELIEVWGTSTSVGSLYQPALLDTSRALTWNSDKIELLVARFNKDGTWQFGRAAPANGNPDLNAVEIISVHNWIRSGSGGVIGALNPDPTNYEFRFTTVSKTMSWPLGGFDPHPCGSNFQAGQWISFTENSPYVGFGIGGIVSGVIEASVRMRVEIREKSTTDGFGQVSAELTFNVNTLPPGSPNSSNLNGMVEYSHYGNPTTATGKYFFSISPTGAVSTGWFNDQGQGPFPLQAGGIMPIKNLIVVSQGELTPNPLWNGFFEFNLANATGAGLAGLEKTGGPASITSAQLRNGDWVRLESTLMFTIPFERLVGGYYPNVKLWLSARTVAKRNVVHPALIHVGPAQ